MIAINKLLEYRLFDNKIYGFRPDMTNYLKESISVSIGCYGPTLKANADYLQTLLQPYEETDIEMYPVSREVNYPMNNNTELLERI